MLDNFAPIPSSTVEAARLRTLDITCARVLGWEPYEYPQPSEDDATFLASLPKPRITLVIENPGPFWRSPDGKIRVTNAVYPYAPNEAMPHFSTDRKTTPLLLAEVERRALQAAYTAALLAQKPADVAADWWLCSAPPDAHARAFVQVMGTP